MTLRIMGLIVTLNIATLRIMVFIDILRIKGTQTFLFNCDNQYHNTQNISYIFAIKDK
jgi:hypothetical protein